MASSKYKGCQYKGFDRWHCCGKAPFSKRKPQCFQRFLSWQSPDEAQVAQLITVQEAHLHLACPSPRPALSQHLSAWPWVPSACPVMPSAAPAGPAFSVAGHAAVSGHSVLHSSCPGQTRINEFCFIESALKILTQLFIIWFEVYVTIYIQYILAYLDTLRGQNAYVLITLNWEICITEVDKQ